MKCSFCLLFVFLFAAVHSKARQSTSPVVNTSSFQKIDSINAISNKIYLSNPAKAMEMAKNALLLAKKYNYERGIGQSYLNMGMVYWSKSYYPISVFYLNTASGYFKKTDHVWLSECYRSIGRDYIDLKNYKQGLSYINKAIAEAGNNSNEYEQALTEESYGYLKIKQYTKAIIDIGRAVKISRQIKQPGEEAILYGRLAMVYLETKQFDKAAACYDTAYVKGLATHNRRLLVTVWIGKGIVAYNLGNYTAAIKYAKTASALANSLGILEFNANANRWLYRSYVKTGDKGNSLFYQDAYIRLQDSLNALDKQNSVKLIQDYFALNKNLNDIDEIERQNKINDIQIKSQRLTIYNLVFVILLLTILVYLLYRNSKQKNLLNKQIQERHAEAVSKNRLIETQAAKLNELNQFKNTLLAVIGHDLKTPVANLRNVVDLFGEGVLSAEELQNVMKEINPAIKGAELTLANLVDWAGNLLKGKNTNVTKVNLASVFNELGDILKHALELKKINLNIVAPPEQNILADENHVKMILRNFLSNAVKFTPINGAITITVTEGPDSLVISVKDSGNGMDDDEVARLFSDRKRASKNGTEGEKGSGIGLLLCRHLAELNGWNIGVTSAIGKGSTFYLSLPAVILVKPNAVNIEL